jgi:hypothetical protein
MQIFLLACLEHTDHFVRRWVLFRKGEPEPQLYHFEDTAVINQYTPGPEKSQVAHAEV